MNPNTAQTLCQIGIAIFSMLAILCGYGSYHYGKKADNLKLGSLQEKQQITNSKLDKLLESVDGESRIKLLEKYPAGYVLFGIDLSSTFSTAVFPREEELLTEYEFDWSKVKIEELTSSSLTILLPNIRYKPLNTMLRGITMTINRRPCGRERILPIRLEGTLHRIFVELFKDDGKQLIFVIGFRKTDI